MLHSLAEARSWALHREVAARLWEHPEIIERAQQRVQKWLLTPALHPYARDWQELLAGSTENIIEALLSTGEQMCTLRQASPFAGALDSRTRWHILKQPELRHREAR
jgi:hypothetical protein